MRKAGDRHNWTCAVGSEHRTDVSATTATLVARDQCRRPVLLATFPPGAMPC